MGDTQQKLLQFTTKQNREEEERRDRHGDHGAVLAFISAHWLLPNIDGTTQQLTRRCVMRVAWRDCGGPRAQLSKYETLIATHACLPSAGARPPLPPLEKGERMSCGPQVP